MGPRQRLLAESYLAMALSFAKRQAAKWPDSWRDEFRSAAQLALCEAALRYDERSGTAFRTFARPRLRGAMIDVLRAMRRQQRADRADAQRRRLRPRAEDPRGVTGPVEDADLADALLRRLDPRDAWICRRVCAEGAFQAEAGARVGLGQSRVSVLVRRSLARLRAAGAHLDLV